MFAAAIMAAAATVVVVALPTKTALTALPIAPDPVVFVALDAAREDDTSVARHRRLIPGYACTYERDVDYSGNDVTSGTPCQDYEACAQLCINMAACSHFSFVHRRASGQCYRKSSNAGATSVSTNWNAVSGYCVADAATSASTSQVLLTEAATTPPAVTTQATTQPAVTTQATTQPAVTTQATTQPAITTQATTQPAVTTQATTVATTQPATTTAATTVGATTVAGVDPCTVNGWAYKWGNTVVCGRSQVGSPQSCHGGMGAPETHDTAVALCAAHDGRLCTVAELNADATRSTGCNMDVYMVWTADACPGGVKISMGKNTPSVQPECVTDLTVAQAVRCCKSGPHTVATTAATTGATTAAAATTQATTQPSTAITTAAATTLPVTTQAAPAVTTTPTVSTASTAATTVAVSTFQATTQASTVATTQAAVTQATNGPVYEQLLGCCRTASGGSGTLLIPLFTISSGTFAEQRAECQLVCDDTRGCVGYELNNNKCEIHGETLAYGQPNSPCLCFLLTSTTTPAPPATYVKATLNVGSGSDKTKLPNGVDFREAQGIAKNGALYVFGGFENGWNYMSKKSWR
jgi:hypothetical protein